MARTQYDAIEKVWRAPDVNLTYACLGQKILENLAKDDPQRVFEIHHDSGASFTVEEIRKKTITVAQNLEQMGLKKGDVVVLYSNSNTRITPITFAAYVLGLQINFFDTTFKEDEIIYELELLDPNLIVYEEAHRPQLFTALDKMKLRNLEHILNINSEKDIQSLFTSTGREADYNSPDLGDPKTVPATLLLTSGSTGYPKVVVHSHAAMIEGVQISWSEILSDTTLFSFSPLRWISQIIFMLIPAFSNARRVYTSQLMTGQLGLEIIKSHKVTHYFGVTSFFISLLETAQERRDSSYLESLHKVMVGGEFVSDSVIELAAKVIPKCNVVRGYGMTETASTIAANENGKSSINGGVLARGLEVKIIDDNGRSLGPNMMGCICLRKKIPFLKYLKNEEANKEAYLDGGWLNTGDYGCMNSENMLNVVTRYKNLVRAGNKYLVPVEVEAVMDSHPGVQVSILVGHGKSKNHPDEIGTIFVILNRTQATTEQDLKEFMQTYLTKDQLNIIKHVRVVSGMPLTSCGKVDRAALKDMASEA